jgi:hypothetical protein
MAVVPIGVGGGRVTSRDAAALEPGELSRADDATYRPGDQALWKVGGRTAFNSTPEAGPIAGARYLEFEAATDLIVTHVGTAYRKATAALTGTFADLLTGLVGGSTLDSVHYNNAHFLLNGADRNREVKSDGTAGFHGMLANVSGPTLARDAGVGTGLTLTAGSTITYWAEERVKSGSSVLRRNAATSATGLMTLVGDGTLDKPVLTRPAVVNSDATHWALMGTATNGTFPNGSQISEVVIGTTSVEDTRTGTDPVLPSGAAYQTISVTAFGVTTAVARNGPPPIATTGDVLEDSLVLNDTSDASKLWYSWPDEPHQFPSVNFLHFETKEADEVTLIRRVNNFLVVGLRDSIFRVDYLPRPEDARFDRGLPKTQIEGAHGIVGPLAADTFSFGRGMLLAYVSRYGVLVTDGREWDVLTDDVDWDNTVDISKLSSARLTNNPSRYRLELDYTPVGGATNSACLFLHYHPSHAKQSQGGGKRAKCTWPIHRAARCSWLVNVGGLTRLFTGHADGKAYVEDEGTADASAAGGIAYNLRTGDLNPGGFGTETRINRAWTHHTAAVGQSATGRMVMRREGEDDHEETWSIPLTRREATQGGKQGFSEAFQFGVENSDAIGAFGVNFLLADVEDVEESTS